MNLNVCSPGYMKAQKAMVHDTLLTKTETIPNWCHIPRACPAQQIYLEVVRGRACALYNSELYCKALLCVVWCGMYKVESIVCNVQCLVCNVQCAVCCF